MSDAVEKAITAQNDETAGIGREGDFNISSYGTWTGTIELQRSWDGGTTYNETVDSFTANFPKIVTEVESGAVYKLKATATMTGTANVRIGSTA